MAIPNAARMRIRWFSTIEQEEWFNVMGLRLGAGAVVDATMAAAVRDAVLTAFSGSGWNSRVASDNAITDVFLRDLRTDNLPEVFASSLIGAGTGTTPYARSAAAVVTLRTALAGKSFRGRTYLSGMTESAVDGNLVISAAYTDAVEFVQAINTNVAAVSGITGLCVISEKLQGSNNVTAIVGRSQVLGSQRRRITRP